MKDQQIEAIFNKRRNREPITWEELNCDLFDESFDANTNRYRPYIAYRGLSDAKHNFDTKIQRLSDNNRPRIIYGKKAKCSKWHKHREKRLLETFRSYAKDWLPQNPSDWEVMLLAQHYGLPTRLLDWSSSPMVALFFATEDTSKWHEDGVIWCANISKTMNYRRNVKDKLNEKKYVYTLEDLHGPKVRSLDSFDRLSDNNLIWFEPPSSSPRIVNQYAFFSVMPGVDLKQAELFANHKLSFWGITIKAHMKREFHERLQIMNITHRTIYPGLEGIAKWLTSYYGPYMDKNTEGCPKKVPSS